MSLSALCKLRFELSKDNLPPHNNMTYIDFISIEGIDQDCCC